MSPRPFTGVVEALPAEEWAVRLRVSLDHFKKHYHGPVARIGANVRIYSSDIHDWLKVLADELESEVQGRFGDAYDALHPALKRRYTRDMQPVVQARALLRHFGDVIPEWPRPPIDLSDIHDCEPSP